ncbi:MAG: metalloregulator ArsR/SmtB family transcription factor [Mariprofundaceae bacterium]|nr:metalloregulator ArsR/SmtB family transcription factor [Mariprofundaceae bacterium]
MSDNRNQDVFCVSKLKMLADSTRLSVLRTLMDGPKNVSELMTMLGVEQSLLSHHLCVLRDAGLVIANRSGKAMLYQLAPGVEGPAASRTINLGCCQLSFDDLHQDISEK